MTDSLPLFTISLQLSISPPSASLPLLGLTLSALSSTHSILFSNKSGILSSVLPPPFSPSLLTVSILPSFPLIWLTFVSLSSLHLSWLTQAKVLPGGPFRGLQNYSTQGQGHRLSALWTEEKWQAGWVLPMCSKEEDGLCKTDCSWRQWGIN